MKEKREFFWEQFKTHQGWADFVVGSPIWAFLILKYYNEFYAFVQQFWAGVGFNQPGAVHWYITLLTVGFLMKVFGLYLSSGIVWSYKKGKKLYKSRFGG